MIAQNTYQSKAAAQLGFWSAIAVTLMVVIFPLSLVFHSLNLAYASSFLLALSFVAMMASIHHNTAPEKKIWSQLGLSFATIYAVMCSLTYYVQLTIIQFNPLQIYPGTLQPFVFKPGTPYFAQDMLGYGFFCMATLAAAPAFTGGKLEVWIRWLFILNGILFTIPTLILPALSIPTNALGTGLGDQVAVYANAVWSAYLALTAALVAVFFKRWN
jgi:hypothetical protein